MKIKDRDTSSYVPSAQRFSAKSKAPIPKITLDSDAFLAKATGQVGRLKQLLPPASSIKDPLHAARHKEAIEARKNKSTNRVKRKKRRAKFLKSNEKFLTALPEGKADINHFKYLLQYKVELTPTERWTFVRNMREILRTKKKEASKASPDVSQVNTQEQKAQSRLERFIKYQQREARAKAFQRGSSGAAEKGVEELKGFLFKKQVSLPIFLERFSAAGNRKRGLEEITKQGVMDHGDIEETWDPKVSAYLAREGAKEDPKIPDMMLKTYLGQAARTQERLKTNNDSDVQYSGKLTMKNLGEHSGAVAAVMPASSVMGFVEDKELSKPAYSNVPWAAKLDKFLQERYGGIQRSFSDPVKSKL